DTLLQDACVIADSLMVDANQCLANGRLAQIAPGSRSSRQTDSLITSTPVGVILRHQPRPCDCRLLIHCWLLSCVVGFDPLSITAPGHLIHPLLMLDVPLDRPSNPTLKALPRFPPQFAFDLARINGVSSVVSRTIFHESNQLTMRHHRIPGPQFVQDRADRLYKFQVVLLVATADVISLSDSPTGQNRSDCLAVIFHE